MFTRSGSDRRAGDRRKRQIVYHDPERREGPRRVESERRINPDAPVLDEPEKPGIITWIFLAGLIFFLYDGFMMQGYWRHATFSALDNEAARVREWSDTVWGPGPPNPSAGGN